MVSEKRIEQEIMLEASRLGVTLFKNNVGTAYRGFMKMYDGKRVVASPTLIRYGLGGLKGSSDLIGITPVTITQEMVGDKIGVFTAVEVKKDKQGSYKATEEQKLFIEFVRKKDGIAGVCDSNEDLKKLLNK